MADRQCTGECLKCSFQQQVYCAAQRTYGIMENQRNIVSRLEHIEAAIQSLTSNDLIPLKEDKAQSSGGADNRPGNESSI